MADRVFAITGAFGVLGAAVADAARAQGEKLVLIDFAPAPTKSPPDCLMLGNVDLADPAAAERAFAAAVDRFGGVDVLLNIAGGFGWETIETGSHDSWLRLYRMNVLTALNASKAALPHLGRSSAGRIVNVGSNAALQAGHGMGSYSAAKAGVHALTLSLAAELKTSTVTVNAVLPSILDTPTNRADMPDADVSTWVSPTDLAAVMLFLASESAQAVTGALVPVTGKV